jgi:uncharacterized protein YdhG (YjbR/CyaY superfamily)
MPEKKKAKKVGPKSAKTATATEKGSKIFTDEERAAMRDYVREKKAAARGGVEGGEESAVLEKIAAMAASDRVLGERIHTIVKASAPELVPRLWYGMPAYSKDGKVVCFFQDAAKFKSRYATLGFSDKANLDEGVMWPAAFALKQLTADAEARIAALVKKAVS